MQLCGAEHLLQLHAFLLQHQALPAIPAITDIQAEPYPDLAEVRGQAQAKRALEIAAAGEHKLADVWPGRHREIYAGSTFTWYFTRPE